MVGNTNSRAEPIKNKNILDAIQDLFKDAEKVELPTKPQGKAYVLDMTIENKSEKWVYFSEVGILTMMSSEKVPAYKIKDRQKLNKLLGI
jgi:hypothetical protein